MIFISSMGSKEQEIDYRKMIICPKCQAYGQIKLLYTYKYLSLFFIPLLKWNKDFFVKMNCCGQVLSLDKKLGQAIKRGENIDLEAKDLVAMNLKTSTGVCQICRGQILGDYSFCPHCGRRI